MAEHAQMKEIDLFGEANDQNKEQETPAKGMENSSKFEDKRPEKINVDRDVLTGKRWKQCKIIGKNVSIRSYSASCVFDGKFYIYGGYQILNGMMSDFYWIDLDNKVDKFDWIQINAKGNKPGARSKHALIAGKSKIYLVGGLYNDIYSSNQIYAFDPANETWQLLKPQGETLPHLDSFGCTYVQSNGQEKIIMICGYNSHKAEYCNAVYEYNITKNKSSILFAQAKGEENEIPQPRSGCSATTNGKAVYIFGGKNPSQRLNDLWEFDLTNFKYKKLPDGGDLPSQRNGHSLDYFEDKIYLFGGIHDITWELDDLMIYSLRSHKWTTLQQDSPRKIEKKQIKVNQNSSKGKYQKKSPKKNWYETQTINQRSIMTENSPNKPYMTAYREQDQHMSPGKMIDEQRRKAFMHRKNEMLKNFEIKKEEKDRYIVLETSSQAMKNSLDVIGNPNPSQRIPEGRLTEFGKHSTSKFLEPLSNNTNLIPGKKPCARDGHCSTIMGNQLIIFGGDRHQMSFNDIYKLNMGLD